MIEIASSAHAVEPAHTQYLIVPAVTDLAGQCRIVMRAHDIVHPSPLQHYREYPQQWRDVGLINSRGCVVALEAPAEVRTEFKDCEPLMAGLSFSFASEADDDSESAPACPAPGA